jgi:hypothetical protein
MVKMEPKFLTKGEKMESPSKNWTDKDWNKFSKWLSSMLKSNDVTVTFTKVDGTERTMLCTLNPEKLPKVEITESKKERKKPTDSLAVYDLEKNGWRSFLIRSVKSVNFTI